MEGNKEEEARLFLVVPIDRTGVNERKSKHMKFYLNTSKQFFTMSVIKHWHRLPREVVESLLVDLFKTHLDIVLGKLALGDPA